MAIIIQCDRLENITFKRSKGPNQKSLSNCLQIWIFIARKIICKLFALYLYGIMKCSKGYGRACPSLSTRVICHNIADLKLCSTKGYFVQLLGKSHRCFCWRDLEAEYLYSVSQSTIYTECIRYITFFVHLLVFQRLHTH